MELLLEKGSLVNIQNHQQMSPLHCAAMLRYPTAAHILLVGKVPVLLYTRVYMKKNNPLMIAFSIQINPNTIYSLGQKFRTFKWEFFGSLPGGDR